MISLNIEGHDACKDQDGEFAQMDDASALNLLSECEEARAAGRDFPTIWNTLLKRHPLVRGIPGCEVRGGEAFIVVQLLSGQKLASSMRGFSLL